MRQTVSVRHTNVGKTTVTAVTEPVAVVAAPLATTVAVQLVTAAETPAHRSLAQTASAEKENAKTPTIRTSRPARTAICTGLAGLWVWRTTSRELATAVVTRSYDAATKPALTAAAPIVGTGDCASRTRTTEPSLWIFHSGVFL